MLRTAQGSLEIIGVSDAPAELRDFPDGTAWVNIDERMGVVSSSRAFAYRDDNRYRRSRLREELVAVAAGGGE